MSGQRHSACTRDEVRLRGLRCPSGVSGGTSIVWACSVPIPFIEQFDYVDKIDVGSESLSKDAVRALDARMPNTNVGWSGQGYGGE